MELNFESAKKFLMQRIKSETVVNSLLVGFPMSSEFLQAQRNISEMTALLSEAFKKLDQSFPVSGKWAVADCNLVVQTEFQNNQEFLELRATIEQLTVSLNELLMNLNRDYPLLGGEWGLSEDWKLSIWK